MKALVDRRVVTALGEGIVEDTAGILRAEALRRRDKSVVLNGNVKARPFFSVSRRPDRQWWPTLPIKTNQARHTS